MRLPSLIRRYLRFRRFGKSDPRFWVYIGRGDPYAEHGPRPLKLIAEIGKFGKRAGVSYSCDEDHTLMLALGWSLYVSWDARGYDRDREWALRLWGNHLVVKWACDDSEVRFDGKGGHKARAGRYWSCFVDDALLGRREYSSVEVERRQMTLTMPEGTYQADCTVTLDTWERSRWPRWPLTRQLKRARIDFDPPVGLPGKGENAYDCDDDATYSLTTPLKNDDLRATLDQFALEHLRDRQRRGGLDWQPREGWPAAVAD